MVYIFMKSKSFYPLPDQAFINFGGYTWVKPDAWRSYLNSTIRIRFPLYYLKNIRQKEDSRWLENDCIFASLSKYLFSQFGVLIPEDSLFKVYNPNGEGILPGKMIEAILAVIEPLGFVIDKVLVADDELRAAMGHPDLVVGLPDSSEFAGKAGLCMINIKDGYSHAFFWKQMDPEKFTAKQFRMAVIVKRNRKDQTGSLSALQCFDEFCRRLSACLPKNMRGKLLQAEIRCLSKYIHDPLNRLSEQFRTRVGQQLASILALSKSAASNSNKKHHEELRFLEESRLIVDRIFRECEEFC
jgi:hypothetical protein